MSDRSQARPEGASELTWGLDDEVDPWTLSPSDFAFLWDDCKRCFYRKVVCRQPRPRSPFPSVFGKIDRAMKDHYLGERAESAAEGMTAGVVGGGDRWVKSAPVALSGCLRPFVIRGQVDVLVDCDDGSLGVVDFKTTVPKADHLATYGRQLHAYAWALEHPAGGLPATVSSLGLLCFLPETFDARGPHAGLFGSLEWVEVPRDETGFLKFLHDVLDVLEGPTLPPPALDCPWCALRDGADADA